MTDPQRLGVTRVGRVKSPVSKVGEEKLKKVKRTHAWGPPMAAKRTPEEEGTKGKEQVLLLLTEYGTGRS